MPIYSLHINPGYKYSWEKESKSLVEATQKISLKPFNMSENGMHSFRMILTETN